MPQSSSPESTAHINPKIIFFGVDGVFKIFQPRKYNKHDAYSYDIEILDLFIAMLRTKFAYIVPITLLREDRDKLWWCRNDYSATLLQPFLHPAAHLFNPVPGEQRAFAIRNWAKVNKATTLDKILVMDVKDKSNYPDISMTSFYPPIWCNPDYGIATPELRGIQNFLQIVKILKR